MITLADLREAGGPIPPMIRAELAATLSIERAGLPPPFGARRHVVIHNPAFYEKQRLRFSTWDTPRFIRATTRTSSGCTYRATR